VRPAVFDRYITVFDVADFAQALAEGFDAVGGRLRFRKAEISDHRQGLLPARRKRPCRRAAEKRYEAAAVHLLDDLVGEREELWWHVEAE
jgi:hypothetical protein